MIKIAGISTNKVPLKCTAYSLTFQSILSIIMYGKLPIDD